MNLKIFWILKKKSFFFKVSRLCLSSMSQWWYLSGFLSKIFRGCLYRDSKGLIVVWLSCPQQVIQFYIHVRVGQGAWSSQVLYLSRAYFKSGVSNLFEPESYLVKGTESYEGLLDSQAFSARRPLTDRWVVSLEAIVTGNETSVHIGRNSLPANKTYKLVFHSSKKKNSSYQS